MSFIKESLKGQKIRLRILAQIISRKFEGSPPFQQLFPPSPCEGEKILTESQREAKPPDMLIGSFRGTSSL